MFFVNENIKIASNSIILYALSKNYIKLNITWKSFLIKNGMDKILILLIMIIMILQYFNPFL